MLKHPGHFTSMKKELGLWTNRFSLCFRCSSAAEGCKRSAGMVMCVADAQCLVEPVFGMCVWVGEYEYKQGVSTAFSSI
jgi:hypothetical protein